MIPNEKTTDEPFSDPIDQFFAKYYGSFPGILTGRSMIWRSARLRKIHLLFQNEDWERCAVLKDHLTQGEIQNGRGVVKIPGETFEMEVERMDQFDPLISIERLRYVRNRHDRSNNMSINPNNGASHRPISDHLNRSHWVGSAADEKDLQEETVRLVKNPSVNDVGMFCAYCGALGFEPEYDSVYICQRSVEQEKKAVDLAFILDPLLMGVRPSRGILALDAVGLLEKMFPDLSKAKNGKRKWASPDTFPSNLRRCDSLIDGDVAMKLAILLRNVSKDVTRSVAKYGLPAESISKIVFLVDAKTIQYTDGWTDSAVKRISEKIEFKWFDEMAQILAWEQPVHRRFSFSESMSRLKNRIEQIRNSSLYEFTLAINGNDLIRLGMKPGKGLGDLLKLLSHRVELGELANEHPILELEARKLIGSYAKSKSVHTSDA